MLVNCSSTLVLFKKTISVGSDFSPIMHSRFCLVSFSSEFSLTEVQLENIKNNIAAKIDFMGNLPSGTACVDVLWQLLVHLSLGYLVVEV
jgi:hypothetical protein